MKNITLLFLASLTLSACATRDITSTGLNVMSENAYHSVVEDYTDSSERYSGVYNTMVVRSTLINSKVATAQMDQSARLYMWDQAKYDGELQKARQKLTKETDIFLSFYTPVRKHDNLARNKTLWRIFLDVEGKRYEGKVTKIKLVAAEVMGLYPYHNTFSSAYTVTFPVPATEVEKTNAKLTITGPVGSVTQSYPPISL